jgi:hypothetical protein
MVGKGTSVPDGALLLSSFAAGRIFTGCVVSGSERCAAAGGEEPMAKRKTGEKSTEKQKPDSPQPQKVEVDFDALVIAGIAGVILKSRKRRTKPWANPR